MTYSEAWIIFLKAVAVLGSIISPVAITLLGMNISGWFFVALIPAIPTMMWVVKNIIESD